MKQDLYTYINNLSSIIFKFIYVFLYKKGSRHNLGFQNRRLAAYRYSAFVIIYMAARAAAL